MRKPQVGESISVRIVSFDVINFLCEIQWAQEEVIGILDDCLRKDTLELDDLPDGGLGLAKSLKVTNWAFEKIVKQVCANEPLLDTLICDDKETEESMRNLQEEAGKKLASLLFLPETQKAQRGAA